ncbi:hypothetical protein AMTR_s00070p00082730 [Amborella trichopoda]|uniref:Uncharacterized protein n=1 Tax=Amborella trichopoda TaxID=13333 RepID=U5D4S9_AMBTC|nr:hypothetical protein AMTR_s00070p00082730 [Amborella trichopoda]
MARVGVTWEKASNGPLGRDRRALRASCKREREAKLLMCGSAHGNQGPIDPLRKTWKDMERERAEKVESQGLLWRDHGCRIWCDGGGGRSALWEGGIYNRDLPRDSVTCDCGTIIQVGGRTWQGSLLLFSNKVMDWPGK